MRSHCVRFRPLALVLVFIYCWSGLQLYNLAHAFPDEPEQSRSSPWAEMGQAIQDLEDVLAQAGDKAGVPPGLSDLRERILAADKGVQEEFFRTEQHLADTNADAAIWERWAQRTADYAVQKALLLRLLDALAEKSASPEQRGEAAGELLGLLESRKRPPVPNFFDPENLPHRLSVAGPRAPRLGRKSLPKNSLLASFGFWSLLQQNVAAQLDLPTADDLAETMEVKFTQEIQDLATSLGNDPVQIYEHVRNNIDYEPTYGSIKGAARTLWEGSGNAFDQASLLIALFRAAGVPARYEYGTIEVSPDQAAAWVGTDNVSAAQTVMSSGGIPTVGITSGGQLVKIQTEHVWVRAWLDYAPSRGKVQKTGDRWIRLDPSFKEHQVIKGIDLVDEFGDGQEQWLDDLLASADTGDNYATSVDPAIIQAKADAMKLEVEAHLAANPELDSATKMIGYEKKIIKEYGMLPCTEAYTVAASLAEYAEVPANKRHTVTFTLQYWDDLFQFWETDFTHSVALPAIAGERVTLGYAPADAASANYLQGLYPAKVPGETVGDYLARASGGAINATLVDLTPKLMVGGVEAKSGQTVGMGYNQVWSMSFSSPGGYNNTSVQNQIVAGSYNTVAFNLGRMSPEYAQKKKAEMDNVAAQVLGGDNSAIPADFMGQVLQGVGMSYWAELGLIEQYAEKTTGVTAVRLPSEGIFSLDLSVVWGGFITLVPQTATSAGVGTDIDTDVSVVVPNDGDNERVINYMRTTGIQGSRLESEAWNQALNQVSSQEDDGVTTAHILNHANANGIPIYTINSANSAQALPMLNHPADVESAIAQAVNAGKEVTVPRDQVTIDGWWTGSGYIIADPNTGAAAYMISGGTNGGTSDFNLESMSPGKAFAIGATLTVLGAAATFPGSVALGGIGIAVGCYDMLVSIFNAMDQIQDPEIEEMVVGALTMFAAIGLALTFAGIWTGGATAFIAVSMLFMTLSIIATTIIQNVALVVDRRNALLDEISP